MKINSIELKVKIEALLREYPELQEDEQLRLDTLEGETDLVEVMTITLDHIWQAHVMQDAIDLRIHDLKARKERYERQEGGWRKFAHDLMDAAHLKNMTLPEATLSIRKGRPSVRITDEAELPKAFMRVKLTPDLTLIKDTINMGESVPGAMLNNAPDTLTILTK